MALLRNFSQRFAITGRKARIPVNPTQKTSGLTYNPPPQPRPLDPAKPPVDLTDDGVGGGGFDAEYSDSGPGPGKPSAGLSRAYAAHGLTPAYGLSRVGLSLLGPVPAAIGIYNAGRKGLAAQKDYDLAPDYYDEDPNIGPWTDNFDQTDLQGGDVSTEGDSDFGGGGPTGEGDFGDDPDDFDDDGDIDGWGDDDDDDDDDFGDDDDDDDGW